jgi:hypothetical protein
MSAVDPACVADFIRLQKRLLTAFSKAYPDVKDMQWLLDFPNKGSVILDGSPWEFVKHGAGLCFSKTSEPRHVVDVHKFVGKPGYVDDWRIVQFVESCGDRISMEEAAFVLREMAISGALLPDEDDGYVVVGGK